MIGYYNDFNVLLVSLSRKIRNNVKSHSGELPLTYEQTRSLSYIARLEGINQSELAKVLETQKMTVTKIVDTLLSMELIVRKKSKLDKRSFSLHVTKKGKKLLYKVQDISQLIFKLISEGIDDKEIESFYQTMLKIKKNLNSDITTNYD